jgi:tRNA 2-thiouridine synthesizing protein A
VRNDFQIDRILDLRGWGCPWYVVKAKSWLNRMEPGQVLELLGTDPESLSKVPSVLRHGKDKVIEVKQYADYHRLLIRRG